MWFGASLPCIRGNGERQKKGPAPMLTTFVMTTTRSETLHLCLSYTHFPSQTSEAPYRRHRVTRASPAHATHACCLAAASRLSHHSRASGVGLQTHPRRRSDRKGGTAGCEAAVAEWAERASPGTRPGLRYRRSSGQPDWRGCGARRRARPRGYGERCHWLFCGHLCERRQQEVVSRRSDRRPSTHLPDRSGV